MRVLISLAALALSAAPVTAQILVIHKVNFTAAGDETPATAKPDGVVSLSAADKKKKWRVVTDYGTVAFGAFAPLDRLKEVATELKLEPEGNDRWQQKDPTPLPDAPDGLRLRARLQYLDDSDKDKPKWVTVGAATQHKECK